MKLKRTKGSISSLDFMLGFMLNPKVLSNFYGKFAI